MKKIRLRRHGVSFQPESERVIIRPFIPDKAHIVTKILSRILSLSEADAELQLQAIYVEFAGRHLDIEPALLSHYEKVRHHLSPQSTISRVRQLLIAAHPPARLSDPGAAPWMD